MKIVKIFAVENMPLILTGSNLGQLIYDALKNQSMILQNNDIVVVTHVAVSKSEGSIVDISNIVPSSAAINLAKKVKKDPSLIELILRETKEIVRIGSTSIITETNSGIVCANAGIDKSNVYGDNNYVLLPRNPDLSAKKIRSELKRITGANVAVIISDSHGRPFRRGDINVAIGIAGIKPIRDRRGEKDLYGYTLKIKQTCVVDELASAAELVIGQANEGVPVAIIRNYSYTDSEVVSVKEILRPKEKDMFRKL